MPTSNLFGNLFQKDQSREKRKRISCKKILSSGGMYAAVPFAGKTKDLFVKRWHTTNKDSYTWNAVTPCYFSDQKKVLVPYKVHAMRNVMAAKEQPAQRGMTDSKAFAHLEAAGGKRYWETTYKYGYLGLQGVPSVNQVINAGRAEFFNKAHPANLK